MRKINLLTFLFLMFLIFSACKKQVNNATEDDEVKVDEVIEYKYLYGIRIDSLVLEEFTVEKGDNLSYIFARLGFDAAKSDVMAKTIDSILDVRKIRAGQNYYTLSDENDSIDAIKYFIFEKSKTDFAILDLAKDPITAYDFSKEIVFKERTISGKITSNLWNAITEKKADPMLAIKLSDLYAWQIDFFDIKEGDDFKIIYDVAYLEDSIPLYLGDIKAARFTHQKKIYNAIPFEQDSIFEFFDENGGSLRKAFLKAPLNFHRISSKFSNARFHPVLKRYRAHHGVDYAAPAGTPVKSIGDGVIVAKAYQKGGAGNYIKIKHNSVYTTSYMHLLKFVPNLSVGQRVTQGQVIGYVGSTGLSTGPHLDFRVYKNGQPIDPLKMESPASNPVKEEVLPLFKEHAQTILNRLDSIR